MNIRRFALSVIAFGVLGAFTCSFLSAQGPFGRSGGAGRFAPGPRPGPGMAAGLGIGPSRIVPPVLAPGLPPGPRFLPPPPGFALRPPVGPSAPGPFFGRFPLGLPPVPAPRILGPRSLGPSPLVAVLVPVPNTQQPPQQAGVGIQNNSGVYQAGGHSYSTARPPVQSASASRAATGTSGSSNAISSSTPLRPGMVLSDGSVVVSVGPASGSPNSQSAASQPRPAAGPTPAAVPSPAPSSTVKSTGQSDGNNDNNPAPASGTESILEVETLPLPPPTDESR